MKRACARLPATVGHFRRVAAAVSSILAVSAATAADNAGTPDSEPALEEIVVTAQKRTENIQAVPISMQAIDSTKLTNLKVADFDDYVKYLPSVSAQTLGPGQSQLYIRGVTNGGDGVKVGSQPLVGVYVDEMPVTTIGNNLDVHVYDMARVEALSGPQGTLFGASSMAGTVRLITNKPDPSRFDAGFDVTGDQYTDGGPGGKLEGFVNLPLGARAAVRLVGWGEHDGGFINIVRGSPQYFPTSGAVRGNASLMQKNSNSIGTDGARAALKVDLNDSWTATTTLMTQSQRALGDQAYTPAAVTLTPTYPNGTQGTPMVLGGTGDLNISRYFPEINRDDWWMATLVLQGKIANFDLTYAGGFIKRDIYSAGDYSDYSVFYDVLYSSTPQAYGDSFVDANGNVINPGQRAVAWNHLNKQSHEIRLATPTDWRLHGTAGLFWERQNDQVQNNLEIPNLSPNVSVDGQPGTLWYEQADRVDRDTAAFTDWTFDVTDQLAITGGIRGFHYDNTIGGFYGFGLNFPSASSPFNGEDLCFTPVEPNNSRLPCQNIDYRATKSSETHRLNMTYKFDDQRMMYGTWSTGFRPGGINRTVLVGPYNPDYLTNFELGGKTTWLDHRLRVNGAVFYERWKDAQFGYLGPQGVSVVVNAGRAAIKGVEAEVQWRATDGLTLGTSFTWLDASLLTNVCSHLSADLSCSEPGNTIVAPEGSRLPVSPRLKGNSIARYEWNRGSYRAHLQGAAVYQTFVLPALRTADEQVLGREPGYASFDIAGGMARDHWAGELYVKNVLDRRGEANRYTGCSPSVCKLVDVIPIAPRLVGVTVSYRY